MSDADHADHLEWLAAVDAGKIELVPPEDLVDEDFAPVVTNGNGSSNILGTASEHPTAGPDDDDDDDDRSRFKPGGTWILDAPATPPAIWGDDSAIVWAAGEPFWIVGPSGIGKTTLLGQLMLRRVGIITGPLLGLPVEPTDGKMLYLASDRPDQARRSLARMVTEDQRGELDRRLVIWPGPPARDIAKHPDILAQTIAEAGADAAFLDSLKDMAVGLANDEVGSGFNHAVQLAISEGFDVVGSHHQRKKQNEGGKPKTIDDVYGSVWIAAGAGSILLMWGTAGDLAIELEHLKSPADPFGPVKAMLDFDAGAIEVYDEVDLYVLAKSMGAGGLTAADAARAMFGTDKPERNEVEKARRRLDKHEWLGKHTDESPPGGGPPRVSWRAVTRLIEDGT